MKSSIFRLLYSVSDILAWKFKKMSHWTVEHIYFTHTVLEEDHTDNSSSREQEMQISKCKPPGPTLCFHLFWHLIWHIAHARKPPTTLDTDWKLANVHLSPVVPAGFLYEPKQTGSGGCHLPLAAGSGHFFFQFKSQPSPAPAVAVFMRVVYYLYNPIWKCARSDFSLVWDTGVKFWPGTSCTHSDPRPCYLRVTLLNNSEQNLPSWTQQ